MMRKTPLLPSLKEAFFGWRYLAFSVLFLPLLLRLVIDLLPVSVSALWLNMAYFAINFAVALLAFLAFWRRTLEDASQKLLSILLTAVAALIVYFLMNLGLSRLLQLLGDDFFNVNDQNIAALAEEDFLLTAIGTAFLAPVAEEIFHRGAVFGGLYRRSRWLAYCVSTFVFALVHINGYVGIVPPLTLLLCFIQYLPAGICLAGAYEVSGSLLTPICVHIVINIIGIAAMR